MEGKRVMLLGCYGVGNLFGLVTRDDGDRLALHMEDGGRKVSRYVPQDVVVEVPRTKEWLENLERLKADYGLL